MDPHTVEELQAQLAAKLKKTGLPKPGKPELREQNVGGRATKDAVRAGKLPEYPAIYTRTEDLERDIKQYQTTVNEIFTASGNAAAQSLEFKQKFEDYTEVTVRCTRLRGKQHPMKVEPVENAIGKRFKRSCFSP